MKQCGVYVIENTTNGHRYVGSSNDIKKRRSKHKRMLRNGKHHSQYLQRAWNKYGEESFIFTPLILCDEENLFLYEQMCIDALRSEYNVAICAEAPMLGRECSEETKRKMSKAQSGENHHNFGKHHSEETKRKISEALMGQQSPNKGKHHSEEAKRKMSEAKSGKNNYWFGKHHSEETKQKTSEALKGRVVSEETRAKMSEAHKGELNFNFGKHLTEDTRMKMSESGTAAWKKRKTMKSLTNNKEN